MAYAHALHDELQHLPALGVNLVETTGQTLGIMTCPNHVDPRFLFRLFNSDNATRKFRWLSYSRIAIFFRPMDLTRV